MKTLLSQLIKNRSVKQEKRICIDKKFNKQLKRHMMHQKIGIILFLVICIVSLISIFIIAFGSIFGIT